MSVKGMQTLECDNAKNAITNVFLIHHIILPPKLLCKQLYTDHQKVTSSHHLHLITDRLVYDLYCYQGFVG